MPPKSTGNGKACQRGFFYSTWVGEKCLALPLWKSKNGYWLWLYQTGSSCERKTSLKVSDRQYVWSFNHCCILKWFYDVEKDVISLQKNTAIFLDGCISLFIIWSLFNPVRVMVWFRIFAIILCSLKRSSNIPSYYCSDLKNNQIVTSK